MGSDTCSLKSSPTDETLANFSQNVCTQLLTKRLIPRAYDSMFLSDNISCRPIKIVLLVVLATQQFGFNNYPLVAALSMCYCLYYPELVALCSFHMRAVTCKNHHRITRSGGLSA
jgi:hypothetical protein